MVRELGYINYTFKMLYVIAIFMIVDGHIGSFDYLNLGGLLRYQNYHLALFIFASGYFFNLNRGFNEFIIHKIKRLIIPLFIWNLIYGVICQLLNTYAGFQIGEKLSLYNLLFAPFIDGHQYIYNMASWFLVPLFFIQLTAFLTLKPFESKNIKYVSAVFFFVVFTVSIFIVPQAVNNNGNATFLLMLFRIFYFLPAFALGFFYHQVLEKYDTLNTPTYLLIILSAISVLIYLFPNYNHIPSWLSFISEPMIIIYTISFLAIAFWLRIAKILASVIKESTTLLYISNHTFDIMMHHFVGIMLLKAILAQFVNADIATLKSDIWYYPLWGNETLSSWIYIAAGFIIALSIGVISRRIVNIKK